jgi:hypothetical protein
VHLSAERALKQVVEARDRGIPAYAETCPQYLFLSQDDLARPDFEGAKYVCTPALRPASMQEDLWRGLRHAYAQQRYVELTGWKAPAAGGPLSKTLTPEQRDQDREVRLIISKELGHEREQITAVYLGR